MSEGFRCHGPPEKIPKHFELNWSHDPTSTLWLFQRTAYHLSGDLKAFERQKLTRHGDLHTIASGIWLALQRHVEVDGAHDAVAELLFDQGFPRCAVVLHEF